MSKKRVEVKVNGRTIGEIPAEQALELFKQEECKLFNTFNRHLGEQKKIDHLLKYVEVLRGIQKIKKDLKKDSHG